MPLPNSLVLYHCFSIKEDQNRPEIIIIFLKHVSPMQPPSPTSEKYMLLKTSVWNKVFHEKMKIKDKSFEA
ncbi:hypothetical protein VIGAN_04153100, partial [Vigna angularis var. angularis]